MGDCHDHGIDHPDYDPDGDFDGDEPRFGIGDLVMVGHCGPYPICWCGYSRRSHSIRYGLRVCADADLEFFDESELSPLRIAKLLVQAKARSAELEKLLGPDVPRSQPETFDID